MGRSTSSASHPSAESLSLPPPASRAICATLPSSLLLPFELPTRPSRSESAELGRARPGSVDLRVFDARGRLVRALDAGKRDAGWSAQEWDGRDGEGHSVPTGVYSVRARTDQETAEQSGTEGRTQLLLPTLESIPGPGKRRIQLERTAPGRLCRRSVPELGVGLAQGEPVDGLIRLVVHGPE